MHPKAMLRITINTFGTRGDIQPYVALAKGLQQVGHEVLILSHGIYESFIREHGIAHFHPLDINPRQVLVEQSIAELGSNFRRITHWLEENFKPVLRQVFQATDEAAAGADLILNSPLSLAGYHVAEKRHLPILAAYLQPCLPTHAFPSLTAAVLPSWMPFRGTYNYLSFRLTNQMLFQTLRPLLNECRSEVLDLHPLSARYYWGIDVDPAVAVLFAYSPHVIPKPADWRENLHVTGYWFLDQAESFQPSAGLRDFLEAGPPPVCIGFGSMVDHEVEATTRLVVDALMQTGQRGILLGGWSDVSRVDLPETIMQIDSVPHDWLFPQIAAVVHHGGAGTTAAGLRAGVPTIVTPFFGDQPFWGRRVAALGVGPSPIPFQKLTAAKLAAAIERAMNDPQIRQNAAILGSKMRSEDGIGAAVRVIESFAADPFYVVTR
jgi:sterol 3beta-glucosyltransferase